MNYLERAVGQTWLIREKYTTITNLAFVARLLFQLSHCSLLWCLALIDKASRELDTGSLNGWAILQDNHGRDGPRRMPDDWSNGDSVNAAFGSSFASGSFPYTLLARLVGPFDLLQFAPLCIF